MKRLKLLRMRAVLAEAAEGRFPSGVERFSMYGTPDAASPAILYIKAYPDSAGDLELVEDLGRVLPCQGNLLGVEALAAHFDLSAEDAEHIFDWRSYSVQNADRVTPKDVRHRLDELLRWGEA